MEMDYSSASGYVTACALRCVCTVRKVIMAMNEIDHVDGCSCDGQTCRHCKQLLCVLKFNPKSISSGLGGWCIECARDHSRRHRVSAKKRKEVFEMYGYRCAVCQTTARLTIDHIVPVLHGGDSDISNLQVLCGECHSSKNKFDLKPSLQNLRRELRQQ